MVSRKLIGLVLFVLGLLWALGMAWVHIVMTGITEPVLPLPLHLFLGFIGPALLIVGSLLVIAVWHIRIGIAFCTIACVLLTWWIGPDSVLSVIDIGVASRTSNHSMKPTAPLRSNFSVFAMTPCRGLSPSR